MGFRWDHWGVPASCARYPGCDKAHKGIGVSSRGFASRIDKKVKACIHFIVEEEQVVFVIDASSCDQPCNRALAHRYRGPVRFQGTASFLVATQTSTTLSIHTVAMRAKLPATAPSSSLLRFLHSQSEHCFQPSVIANSQGFASGNGEPQQQSKPCNAPAMSRIASRNLVSVGRSTSCLSSPLHLDFLAPSFASPRATFSTTTQRPRPREIRKRTDQAIGGSRYASEDRSPSWLGRLFGKKSARRRPLRGVADESIEASPYTIGRTVSVKAANEQKLRCTEFDENGNVVLVNGEFKKSELIAKVCSSCPVYL